MQALVPPQITLMLAVGAIASLWLKRSCTPRSAASGHAPRSSAEHARRLVGRRAQMRNILRFADRASALSNGMPFCCRYEWKPIAPKPTDRSRMAE